MSDFAPNFTARYQFHYSSLGKSHTMLWRVGSEVTDPTDISEKVGLVLEDLKGHLWADFTVSNATFAPADSDIFLPAPAPTFSGGTVSVGGSVPNDAAGAISFVGRSIAGGKARMFLYGTDFPSGLRTATEYDFKITSAEVAAISAAIVRLNETAPALVANDNNVAIWYEYVNYKANDRWVRKMRRG